MIMKNDLQIPMAIRERLPGSIDRYGFRLAFLHPRDGINVVE
jgi:hypothetical protein